MTSIQKIALALISILMPVSVVAAGAPLNVRGIQMNSANGAITVTWQAVKENVAFYRVYYSHTSILGNQGNYDDFERTRGLESAYTFSKAPLANGTLFVSVLAVSPDGTESEGFEEEASIDLGVAPTPVVTAVPTATPPSTPMTITSVGPVSSTGILVTFSEDVALNDTTASDGYFVVTDTGGTLLATTRVNVVASTVLIHTNPQTPEKTYILMFAKVIPGVQGGSILVTTAPAKFLGFTSSVASTDIPTPMPVAVTPPSTPVVAPVYVRNPYVTPPTAVGTVPTPEPTQKKDLPGSGVPFIGIAMIAGAGALARRLRRKKVA